MPVCPVKADGRIDPIRKDDKADPGKVVLHVPDFPDRSNPVIVNARLGKRHLLPSDKRDMPPEGIGILSEVFPRRDQVGRSNPFVPEHDDAENPALSVRPADYLEIRIVGLVSLDTAIAAIERRLIIDKLRCRTGIVLREVEMILVAVEPAPADEFEILYPIGHSGPGRTDCRRNSRAGHRRIRTRPDRYSPST